MKRRQLQGLEIMRWDEKIFWIPAFVLLFLQISSYLYLNLLQMPYFTGYDASAYYVLAHEMVEQRSLVVENFVYNTTTMLWDSPLLLAAMLHFFVDDIFICYGIANVISMFFLIFTVILLSDILNMEWKGKITVLLLLLTPYVSNYYMLNDLGYISMLFVSMGAYAWRLPCILWVQILFLEWDLQGVQQHNRWKFVLGLSFLAINLLSSGSFLLVFGIAPLVLFVILRGIMEDKWIGVHNNSAIFAPILMIMVIICRLITKYVLKFESLDTGSFWVNLHQFFENLQSIFLGFMELVGGIPLHNDISVFTVTGILYGMRLFVAFALLGGLGFSLWTGLKGKTGYQVLFCLICSHLLIFSFLYTTYGSTFFEIRYLIFIMVALMFFLGITAEKIASSNNNSLRIVFGAAMSLSLIGINISSHIMLQEEKNDYDFMVDLAEFLGEHPEEVVYFAGESGYFQAFSASMRAVDFSKIYKYAPDLKSIYHCGDYDYFDDNGAYDGGTFLITVPWMYNKLDPIFRDSYELYHSYPDEEIFIYRSSENVVDLAGGVGNHPVSRDFPYSSSVDINDSVGFLQENGTLRSKGETGYLCSSSFEMEESVTVDFQIHYENVGPGLVYGESLGNFDITVDGELVGSESLESVNTSAGIFSVELPEDSLVSYSVFLHEGAEIAISSFEIIRK